MTFEQLQEQWKRQDLKLDTMIHLVAAHARATHLDSMTTALGRVRRTIWIEMLFALVGLVVLGSFMALHIGDLRYVAPALVLHVCAIGTVAASVRQLLAARQVDYTEPVIKAQRRLTALRLLRISVSKWTFLVAPALWTPLLIVAMKGVLGIDFYSVFDSRWIAANIIWSVALIPLIVCGARRYDAQLPHSPLLQRIADDLAGRSLNEATAFGQQLVDFERQYDDARSA